MSGDPTTCVCGCGAETTIVEKNTYRAGVLVYRKGERRRFARNCKPRRAIPLSDRIWQYVGQTGPCWLWTGLLDRNGYGRISGASSAYRAVWELLRGPVPDGLELDHLCRVNACVNPDHLEPVTHAENMRRANLSEIGCQRGHEPTPENVYVSPRGRRNCRACERERRTVA